MFKFKNIKFYNWETGERISPWVGFPLLSFLLVCFIAFFWQFILLGYEVRDYLQNESHKEKAQTYSTNISPKTISASCVHAGDRMPVFVIADTHFKASVKDKGASNDV